ncbi:uncharacterized protein LOC117302755 [Asterias rubens]|uniref:uncharacterized protein LOC117302755 n=1 Tax=Asterias rubens TaxID=7604 RepID=UPI001455D401|nr:uncharacterized protein LOC117302755 [Asterias rubens]
MSIPPNRHPCCLGHINFYWNRTGESRGPRCPMCLSLPLRDACIASDRPTKLAGFVKLLSSVTRRQPGEKLDPEAMALALGRDKDWRVRQVEIMRAIQRALTVAKFDQKITFCQIINPIGPISINHDMEWRQLANLLMDAGILEVSTLLLKIRIPNLTDETDVYGDPWESIYFYTLETMSNILLTSHWENPRARAFTIKAIGTDYIHAVMAFVKETKYFMVTIMAIYNFCHIFTDFPAVGIKLDSSGIMTKLGYFLHKDNSIRIMNKWMQQGLFAYELDQLMENPAGLLPLTTVANPDVKNLPDCNDQELREIGIQFASTLQQTSLQCLGFLSKDKAVRSYVTKDQLAGRAVSRWLRMPILSTENCYMLQACLKVLSEMVHVNGFAWKLLDDYGFMGHLEKGAFYPSKDVIWHYLEVATRIGMHRGLLLKRIVENPLVMRSAGIHMYSLEPNCHVYSIALLTLAVDNPGVEYVIKYFGPRHFYYYSDYFFNKTPIIGIKVSELQNGCRRLGKKMYDRAEKEFSKTRHLILDAGKASELKEKGNKCYKSGKCQEAITLYTQALNVCPPTKPDKKGQKREQSSPPLWSPLPATLLSNRAQCYINLGDYEKAVEDCDEAIARCLGATDEDDPTYPDTVRYKAIFRRSKGLFELGQYFRSMQDIAECQLNQPCEMFKAHLDKVMIRFRVMMGPDPMPRCDECVHYNGARVKRCTHCMATYCSKKCQETAWVKRHKINCQEYQAEMAAKKEGTRPKPQDLD